MDEHKQGINAVQVRAGLVDWTQPYTGPRFDVVLACDVLYEAWPKLNTPVLPCHIALCKHMES